MDYVSNQKVVETLVNAREKIESEAHWCRGIFFGKSADGTPSYCMVGALYSALQWECFAQGKCLLIQKCMDILAKAVGLADGLGLGDWNDNATHKQVLEAYNRAIAQATPIKKGAKLL